MIRFLALFGSFTRWLVPRSVPLAALFLVTSVLLLVAHARAIRAVREIGLPAAVLLPSLEKRLAVLEEQVEVVDLQQAVTHGSVKEMIATFILPSRPDLDRVLLLFDVLRDHLQGAGLLRSMSAIHTGEEENIEGVAGIRATPLTFTVDVTQEGLRQLLGLLRLSGLLSVADALNADEIHQLLQMTEEEDPSSVSTIEHFLSAPLLQYAREPKAYEEQVGRSFASPGFDALFSDLLRHSVLAEAREILGGDLGRALAEERVWPLRFLTVDRVVLTQRANDLLHADIEVRAYVREP